MPRDIQGTKLEAEFFELIGNPVNPTAEVISKLFAYHKEGGMKYHTDDIITIGPDKSPFVKANSTTTIGIYIINKYLFEDLGIFGYVNKVMTSKRWGEVEKLIADARIANDISIQQVHNYIDRSQALLGGPLAHIISPSLSSSILNLPPSAQKLRKDLLEENKEGIAANDPQVSSKIEHAVVDEALRVIHKNPDPGVSIFDSGAIDPYNNYRTMFVMKGAIVDNTGESPTGYKIVTSNYNDGISKEDMPIIADSLVTAAYNKGVLTQDSGTLGKKYNAVLQNIRLLPKGSDCGTTKTRKQEITENNAEDYLYRYIVEKGKLVQLTPENANQYVGKTVDMRTPIHCKSKDPCYCSVCTGERLYRVGIKNVGLTFNTISGSLLNASMKKFHDISIKTYRIGVKELTKYVK